MAKKENIKVGQQLNCFNFAKKEDKTSALMFIKVMNHHISLSQQVTYLTNLIQKRPPHNNSYQAPRNKLYASPKVKRTYSDIAKGPMVRWSQSRPVHEEIHVSSIADGKVTYNFIQLELQLNGTLLEKMLEKNCLQKMAV